MNREEPFILFPARVAEIRDMSPSFRRVTFHDPSLTHFADARLDQRIKLFFPCDRPYSAFMSDGVTGLTHWRTLPNELRHPMRTYTTRATRRDDSEIDVDFVMHDVNGPASEWITTAAPGDELVILGPNGNFEGDVGGVDFVPPHETHHYLLVGDETAAPAIAVILEQLPAHARGTVMLEVPFESDRRYLPSHPGFDITILGRNGASHGDLLYDAAVAAAERLIPVGTRCEIEEIDVDQDLLWEVPRHARGGAALKSTSLYAWLAGEAGVVKRLRRHLVGTLGLDRRTVAFMGYWRLGRPEN